MEIKRKQTKAYRAAVSGVLAALTLIFSYVEVLIPFNFGVPGIKLGLSNLVVLIALYSLGTGYAFVINIVRIMLTGFLFTGLSAMLYSIAGGLLSFAVMMLLKKTGLFSPAGVSMAGGVFHNIGQLTVAALVTETTGVFLYLSVLMVSGIVTGILLGIIGTIVLIRANGLLSVK